MTIERQRHQDVRALFMELFEQGPDVREHRLAGVDAQLAAEVRSLLVHMTDAPLLAAPPAQGDPLGLCGQLVDDRYQVERFVAEGGFSYVYQAEQVRWRRKVALKAFKTSRAHDERVRDAFIKEGALLAQLSQLTTAIVQSYDIGTLADGTGAPRLFTALEWLEGRTLARLCADEGMPRFSFPRLFSVLDPIAQGLGVAHRSGIAHRDVKPANIFLIEREGHNVAVKLLDFGVAKVAAEHARGFDDTGNTIKAFTLGYGAPEQLKKDGPPSGPWTDVYSLALVATELLAGRRIVDAGDPISAMKRLNEASARATPRELGAQVSRRVEKVFRKALAPRPDDRYPDVSAFWTALHHAAPRRWGSDN